MIEYGGERVKLSFLQDEFGFTPFQIAQEGRFNDCKNLLIQFCIDKKLINLTNEFLPAEQLQYIHENDGSLNARAVELINGLPI